MKVLVAGAHGKVGRHVVRLLAEDGHDARAMIRSDEQADEIRTLGGSPVIADLESDDSSAISRAVEGADAIVFSAGAGPGSGAARKETVDYGGAAKLIRAAKERGVRRYVMVSSIGAHDPEGADEPMRPYLRAKAKADEELVKSGLDYTIIRPGGLTDDSGTGLVDASTELGRRARVPREDVAATIVACLEMPETVGRPSSCSRARRPSAKRWPVFRARKSPAP
jgi:uncharacterized protein YbjT (DUF2867 family)